jgi:Rhodopirellula transposase DDE domain
MRDDPIISVDAKKRELVGNFKNDGKAWSQAPRLVNDHDFRSLAKGVAIPYVIYNTEANRAFVCVGTSRGTPEFAVDSIERWWRLEGRRHYPDSNRVLILADGGGGNGHRARVWKARLQDRVCDRHQLTITVCHYPPGTSKWNPVEHRVNCEISRNWQAVPLDSCIDGAQDSGYILARCATSSSWPQGRRGRTGPCRLISEPRCATPSNGTCGTSQPG